MEAARQACKKKRQKPGSDPRLLVNILGASKMSIQQAASKVRAAIKREKINPRGMVSVMNNDYVSELKVDLRFLPSEARDRIASVINEIDGDFVWDVM